MSTPKYTWMCIVQPTAPEGSRERCFGYEIDKRRVVGMYHAVRKKETALLAHDREVSQLAKAVAAWDERLDNCRVAVVGENRTLLSFFVCVRIYVQKKVSLSFFGKASMNFKSVNNEGDTENCIENFLIFRVACQNLYPLLFRFH